jgi:hypothetical protein
MRRAFICAKPTLASAIVIKVLRTGRFIASSTFVFFQHRHPLPYILIKPRDRDEFRG